MQNEIRIEQREFISAVKEGWLHKQGGRVKTWKRRYVILSGNVLYYFKSPKDKEPLGMVPLEDIEARPAPRILTLSSWLTLHSPSRILVALHSLSF